MATTVPLVESRREQVGWYFYDWANSAFTTTVVTVLLGPYLTALARAVADADGLIHPLGIPMPPGSFFPYIVGLAALLQVVLLPVLGAIADYSNLKKRMLALFAYLGVGATLLMAADVGYLTLGLLFLIANTAFGASIVFYNAFLSEIAPPERRDAVSSNGWAMGYLGGGLLLAANLALLSQAERLGLTTVQAVRISIASAAVWWGLFALIPLATLRSRREPRARPPGSSYVSVGFRQLRHTLGAARYYPHTLLFLLAYLLYNDGVQAVISLSSQFGQEELGLPIATLTTVILMVQFVAFFGALAFGRLAGWIGAKRAILLSLMIWTGVVVYAYGALRTQGEFFALAAAIGVVLGGTQALTRSLYSTMIPPGQEAEYFSLHEVYDKGTSWLAPILFGASLQATGSYRVAILSLAVFFILGTLVLTRVDVARAAREAHQ